MRTRTPADQRRVITGFFERYMSGQNILDIGYAGENPDNSPVVDNAIGVDLNYPGYDGIHLPFPDASQDTVFSGHCYEHVENYRLILQEWYRVLRIGGYIAVLVPHKYLYERKSTVPSFFNPEHKRFYTPASLLREFEEALPVNGFRVRHLADIDIDFDYSTPIGEHAHGSCEIELVVQKIQRPSHSDLFELPAEQKAYVDNCRQLIINAIKYVAKGDIGTEDLKLMVRDMAYFPPYHVIKSELVDGQHAMPESYLKSIVKTALSSVKFDEALYLQIYPDIKEAINRGMLATAVEHFVNNGYFEGRVFQKDPACALLPDGADRNLFGSRLGSPA
jgi:SAM-dependent methyltransferase